MNDIGGGPPSYKEFLIYIVIIFMLAYWAIQMPLGIFVVKPKVLAECEKTLPRDQECELIALPRFKTDR